MSEKDARTTQEMLREIAGYDDEQLERELVFAEGFGDPMPEAVAWLYLLRAETKERKPN